MDDSLDNLAAIVSRGDEPLLYGERSEPVDDADSGWQFSAGPKGEADAAAAQVWALSEVLEREPSLRQFASLPFGTALSRASVAHDWQVSRQSSKVR